MEYVKDNILKIRYDIDQCISKNNIKEKIELMAVTKTVAPEIVNFAIANGIDSIGENRVQEFLAKRTYYNLNNLPVNFIGHLQTNKVKSIVDKVDMIQSVDSLRVLTEINQKCSLINKKMEILLQVNISNEESKYGIKLDEIDDFLGKTVDFEHIIVKGFMAIPKKYDKISETIKDFDKMFNLYIDNCDKKVDNRYISVLSMGMSNDYDVAINCGSNLVRVGSGIFGRRK